ncbi:MAG: MoaD/ThiS family protein [Promethearchaeia archaeon]
MAKVNLNLLNIFALKVKENVLQYEGDTVGDIISQFIKDHGDKLDNNLLSKNKKKLNKQILILVNGRNIEYLKRYKTPLKDGDELYLSIPLSGG